eukprot:TRINITY_DN79989_c0_g1_i1.p1 TRINITY_DN79989_c0_g1~~TRINITY_DN79989_c0_g1_i1.p1  ORF type:complete len:758 (+),score=241.13 TRINITY_DN79989_c0_g1_i1:153-2276(+)
MLREQNLHTVYGESEARVEALRRQRQEASERRELFTDYCFVQKEQEKERKKQLSELEERLADELERRKAEEVRKEVVRQQIIQGSDEIRALKGKLSAAEANKVRAQQMLEKQAREELEMHREAYLAARVEDARLEAEEAELRLEQEKALVRKEVKVMNEEQIALKERQKEEALREFQKDKVQVDELVARIEEEDKLEMAQRQQKKDEVKRMIMEYQHEQVARRREEEQREAEESERIEAFARKKQEQEERIAKEKREQEEEKQRIQRAMIGQREEVDRQARELEQLRQDLWQEEKEEEERRKELVRARKRLEDQQEMLRDYQASVLKAEKQRQEKVAQEQQTREELLNKYAEDERLEQMSAQKRRMKLQEYKRDVDRQMQIRRQQYEEQRQKERDELERLKAEEALRAQIVEEERQKLLREHGPHVRHHLPKGTFAKEDDFDVVGLEHPGPIDDSQFALRKPRDNYIGIPPYPVPVQQTCWADPPDAIRNAAAGATARERANDSDGNALQIGGSSCSSRPATSDAVPKIGQNMRGPGGKRPPSAGPLGHNVRAGSASANSDGGIAGIFGSSCGGGASGSGARESSRPPSGAGDAGVPLISRSARGSSRPPGGDDRGAVVGHSIRSGSRPPSAEVDRRATESARSNSRSRVGDGVAELLGHGSVRRPESRGARLAPSVFQPPSRRAEVPAAGCQPAGSRGAGSRQAWT